MNKHTAELLEKHFDTAFSAPDGIKKLRELILTLAMQGKLVPQDPNDQSASELLQEIEAEKNRMVKAGVIKKPKSLPKITKEEQPYSLPQGWEWVRLGNIGIINPRNNADNDMPAGFVPMPLIQEGYSEFHSFEERPWGDIKKGYTHFADGDVGMAKITPCFENAKSCVFSNLPSGIGAGTTELHIFRNDFHAVDPHYLLFFLKNPKFISATAARMTGSAGQKRVPTPLFAELELPLPPISEQHRIVAKIDELMARSNEIERLRIAQKETCLTVHAAAIKQLLNITEPAKHYRAQAFLAEHFGELYTVKENVAELRKAILQLAVMGKLVPDAEPARLMPLESMLAEASINGVSKGPVDDSSKTEILRISAGTSRKDFYVDESDIKYVNLSENEIEKFKLQADDLLACRFNGNLHYVGRFSLYKGASGRVQVNPDKLIRFRINTEKFFPRYICYAMNSKTSRDVIESMCATTAGNIGLSAGRLKKVSIPTPSLAQQKEIVSKIDELMALCDSMDQKIDAAVGKKTEFLNALINPKSQRNTAVQLQPASLSTAQVIDLATYRASIGCYALSKLANAQYFGRTAAAKVMYLAQAHIGLDLDLKPEREAAGPLDTWIYDFERQGQGKSWFEVNEKTLANARKKTEYRCLSALSEPAAKAEVLMTPSQKTEFDRLIYALADKKTEEVEIIATLFAVWNDFLIDGVQPTDTQIISDVRENWHDRKTRFTPAELGRWLDWLRRENIIPQGLPPRTVQQSRFGFD